jgi:hypothetical protein
MIQVAEATDITAERSGSQLLRVIARAAEARLCAPDRLTARAGEPDRLLVSLLREVDETVLPRVLELETDSGAQARLAVSNRRLCSVGVSGEAEEIAGPEDAAQVFLSRLRRFLGNSQWVKVRRHRSIGAEGEEAASCSALHLARCGGIPLAQLGYAAGLDGLLQAVSAMALTWLYLLGRGREAQHGGDAADLAVLSAFNEAARAMRKGQIANPRPHCTVLDVSGARILLRAQAGGETLVMLASAQDKQAIMAAWQKRI